MSQEVAPKQTKAMALRKLLTDCKVDIARALPAHVSPDRMLRIALTSARKNPELLDCNPESFLGAVIQSAQLGLEPDTPMGHAYLLPFRSNKSGQKEVNFMPGYRGLMELVYRAADAPILMPTAVYEGDVFEYEKGLHPRLVHVPKPHGLDTKLTHTYCVASFKDGRKEFLVMDRAEIEAIRNRSKAASFSPWKTDYEAMALKTVIRRMVKYLPMSAELQTAVGLDEKAELGFSQDNADLLKPEGAPIHTKRERVEGKMDGSIELEPGEFKDFAEGKDE